MLLDISADYNFFTDFIIWMTALIAVCALAVIVIKYVLPRLKFVQAVKGARSVEVLSRASLGPRQFVYVVRIENKTVALGVTDHQISFLTDVNLEKDEASL